jgi:hypothetical protein
MRAQRLGQPGEPGCPVSSDRNLLRQQKHRTIPRNIRTRSADVECRLNLHAATRILRVIGVSRPSGNDHD